MLCPLYSPAEHQTCCHDFRAEITFLSYAFFSMMCRDKKAFEEIFMNSCPKFLTPDMPDYEGLPENVGKVNMHTSPHTLPITPHPHTSHMHTHPHTHIHPPKHAHTHKLSYTNTHTPPHTYVLHFVQVTLLAKATVHGIVAVVQCTCWALPSSPLPLPLSSPHKSPSHIHLLPLPSPYSLDRI